MLFYYLNNHLDFYLVFEPTLTVESIKQSSDHYFDIIREKKLTNLKYLS